MRTFNGETGPAANRFQQHRRLVRLPRGAARCNEAPGIPVCPRRPMIKSGCAVREAICMLYSSDLPENVARLVSTMRCWHGVHVDQHEFTAQAGCYCTSAAERNARGSALSLKK